jgi:hypothetical protein
MTRRIATAVSLIALAVILGTWLTKPPVTAAPPAPSTPILAPSHVTKGQTTLIPVVAVIVTPPQPAAPTQAVVEPPANKTTDEPAGTSPRYRPRRRGFFRRW